MVIFNDSKVCTDVIDKKEFCHICHNLNNRDGKTWIACDKCSTWYHVDCEQKQKNGIKNLEELLVDENYKYFCLKCRNPKKVRIEANPRSKGRADQFRGAGADRSRGGLREPKRRRPLF